MPHCVDIRPAAYRAYWKHPHVAVYPVCRTTLLVRPSPFARRGSGGSAQNHRGPHQNMTPIHRFMLHQFHGLSRRKPRHLNRVLMDRRQIRDRGDATVVKADDGHILGHADAEVAQPGDQRDAKSSRLHTQGRGAPGIGEQGGHHRGNRIVEGPGHAVMPPTEDLKILLSVIACPSGCDEGLRSEF